MGKKKTITMDQSQEDELDQRTTNKYKKNDSFDLPDEFAELEALYAREAAADKGGSDETTVKAVSKKKKKVRSQKFLNLKKKVDQTQKYNIEEAVKLVKELAPANFEESVELHIESRKENISGSFNLPHGSGKEKKVVVFDEKVLKQIEDQKIDFDVLIAKPEDMAKLAKHAKFLGPRGLMPNPKKGTITTTPEKAIKEFSGGKVHYKTEKKAPLVHLTVGKINFEEKKLVENLTAVFKELNPKTLKKASLCSSMGPGLKLDITKIVIEK